MLAFALAALASTVATAGKKTPPPAPYYDVNEGGWVDLANNLVWGLDYTVFTTSAPNGSTGFDPPVTVDWATAEDMAANYPTLLAQCGWTDAATIASYWESQGLLWRQPTATEASAFYSEGIISNIYADYNGTPRWTSSAKYKNGVLVGEYVIDLASGAVELDIANPGFPLFVRPYR
ncbi:MAG: hypothetical protein ACM3U2_04440 [Deltaproteobacteria bacterium]